MRRVEEGRLTSLNLSSSSMKATMIARERATACLTLSALSSISICFSIESTREPRSSALGGEEGRRRVEEKGGGGRRRGRGRMEGKNGCKEGMHMWQVEVQWQIKITDVLVCMEPALHMTQPQGDVFQNTCE